jgi:hypothetical protein
MRTSTLANLDRLRVDGPEGPSSGVEYFRERWVPPSAVEAVAAALPRTVKGDQG